MNQWFIENNEEQKKTSKQFTKKCLLQHFLSVCSHSCFVFLLCSSAACWWRKPRTTNKSKWMGRRVYWWEFNIHLACEQNKQTMSMIAICDRISSNSHAAQFWKWLTGCNYFCDILFQFDRRRILFDIISLTYPIIEEQERQRKM